MFLNWYKPVFQLKLLHILDTYTHIHVDLYISYYYNNTKHLYRIRTKCMCVLYEPTVMAIYDISFKDFKYKICTKINVT